MSIIQEALKKAQRRSVTTPPVKKEPVRQDIVEEIPSYTKKPEYKIRRKSETRRSNSRIILYGAILACVFAVLFVKYYPSSTVKNTKIVPVAITPKISTEPTTAIPALVVIRTQNIEPARELQQSINQDDFKLSGIMDLEDGRRAIINSLVVVEGDCVGDVRVETITSDKVILRKDKNSITLKLK